jgi:putative glutamine amidotransferase
MPTVKDRPLIGINTDYRALVKGRTPHTLMPSGYYDVILSANAIPVLIPPLIKEHDLTPILDRLDGVMLTGGDDLDPKKMGLAPHPSVTVMSERRESADRMLIKLIQQRKMPVLGVGLGMQELNVVNGGGIFLHIPEDMPKSIPHRDPQGGVHRHTVIMEPGTRLEEIYGPGEIRVNSYHHQGIRKLAPIFRVGALAPDGLIEAFEGKDPSWWVVGVQWHPENDGAISLDTQLIEAFTEAASGVRSKPSLSLAKEG